MRLSDSAWRGLLNPIACEVRGYVWRIPSPSPVPFTLIGCSLDDNLALRQALHCTWMRDQQRRQEIATWYVSRWGGIRKNKPETIQSFVDTLGKSKLPSCMSGVASWSKIAAIADPSRWAIFDARVAFSLNALQHVQRGKVSEPFPVLPSRNTLLRRALVALRRANNLRPPNRSNGIGPYQRYLEVLGATKLGLQRLEMALFVAAEPLAKKMIATRS